MKIKYDKAGRMQYHPSFHKRHGTPWSREDIEYLINWYYKIGANEMSFALERPSGAIVMKVSNLAKKGKMKR